MLQERYRIDRVRPFSFPISYGAGGDGRPFVCVRVVPSGSRVRLASTRLSAYLVPLA